MPANAVASAANVVCLVTGGSRGIGRSICIALAARGATVVFSYNHDATAAEETLERMRAATAAAMNGSGEARAHKMVQCDVSDATQCQSMVATVLQDNGGKLDVLINNAGICMDHDVMDETLSFDAWQTSVSRIMAVNFTGASNLCFLAAKAFQKRHEENVARCGGNRKDDEAAAAAAAAAGGVVAGRIINITSRAVYRGEPTAPGYAASKAALSILGQSLARRLGPSNIAVFTVAPGWVETEMAKEALNGPNAADVLAQHPLGRVAAPDEIANQVVYLALSAPLAMTGATIDMNGASYLR